MTEYDVAGRSGFWSSKAYDMGWDAGYKDEIPNCPFVEGSDEAKEWWNGYEQGSRDC